MSDARLKDLLELARDDGPSEDVRDKMWVGIQGSTLGASALATAKGATAKGAGILSSKLALGIALGASITVGIAGAVLVVTRNNVSPPTSHVTSRSTDGTNATPRGLDRAEDGVVERRTEAVRPPVVITGHVGDTVELKDVAPTLAHAASSTVLSERDRLALEARMVSEARGALHRGDAEAALRVVRAARATQGARLVPEELTVEAQALRALGDEAGAKRVEAILAGKFPEQAPEQGIPR